jgi:hypothetical protein
VSQTLQANDLPTSPRALRVGPDDDAHIRRTILLAAAKIEDLQEQVTSLVTMLEATGQRGSAPAGCAGLAGGNGSREERRSRY